MPAINRTADSLLVGGTAGGILGAVTWGVGFFAAAPVGVAIFAGTSAAYYFGTAADDTITSTLEKVDKTVSEVGTKASTILSELGTKADVAVSEAGNNCSRATNAAIGCAGMLAGCGIFAAKNYFVEETVPSFAFTSAGAGLIGAGALTFGKAVIG